MTFAHPVLLPLALLPLIWAVRGWRDRIRRQRVVLKALALSAIAIALAQPELTLPETRTALLTLIDTSDSISSSDLARASSLVSEMQAARRSNSMHIVPFAGSPQAVAHEESRQALRFTHAVGGSGTTTNLEAALNLVPFMLPEDRIPRVALVTDGNENDGSAARALTELRRLTVPVDTFSLGQRTASAFQLASVSMPRRAYAGEQVPIDLTILSPVPTEARVELSAEAKSLGSSTVHLAAGASTVRIDAHIRFSGTTVISGTLTAPQLGELPFRQSIDLSRARVLYVSQDPPGSDANLLSAFEQAGFEISRDASKLNADLRAFQLIVLNNLDLNSLSADAKERLEGYVRSGGGLLLIGGEKQIYKEDRQMDALDRALPARLAPPQSPEGTCVALIVDKSSSMEGRKIELARLSAIGVVDHLRPTDYIGVLIFDNSFQWAVPMRRAEDKTLIKRLISGITPDGGTQIAPALAEAYRRVLGSRATYKHIVLLTDGISEEGDSVDLAREAVAHNITISTVGLGQDVNRSYLEKVAATSGGKSYFLNDPAGLEQILLKDVKDYSGSTAVERPLMPIVVHKAEVLDGTGMETAPPLKGYARYIAKPAADTVLQIDPDKKDPLYVRWQYGLGRTAVFTSDAKSRWAAPWIQWSGFDRFWINLSRDLLAHLNATDASARFDPGANEIVATYRIPAPEPERVPSIYVIGPNDFRKPLSIHKVSQGLYMGSAEIGNIRGLFRIRPAAESDSFPEIGVYRGEEELLERGTNEPLLRVIANTTGGRYNPPASSVFDPGGRALYRTLHLWPAFLGLAIALNLAELVARKWSGLIARFAKS